MADKIIKGPIERGEMPGFTMLLHMSKDWEPPLPVFAYCYEGEMKDWLFVQTEDGFWKALVNVKAAQ